MLSGQIDSLLAVRNMEYDLPIVAGQATGELTVDGTRVPFRLRVDFAWHTDCWGGFRESRSLALGPWIYHLSIWHYKSLLAPIAQAYWDACHQFTEANGLFADDEGDECGGESASVECSDLDGEEVWLCRHGFTVRGVVPDDFPSEARGLVVTSDRPRFVECSVVPNGWSLRPDSASDSGITIHGLIRQIEASEVGVNGMSYEVTGEIDYNGRLVPLSYTLATAPAGDCTADIEEWSLVFGECADCIPIVVRQGDRSQDYAKIELGSCEKDLPAWLHIECGQALRILVMAQITDSGHLLPSADDESVESGKLYYDERRVYREPLPIVLRSDSARQSKSAE